MKLLFSASIGRFLLLGLLTFSSSIVFGQDIICAKAKVYEGVPVAADGCGVSVKIDTVMYKAEGIPKEFIVDGMDVVIKYKMGETFYCGRGQFPIQTIQILSIDKASNKRKKCCKKRSNK